MMRTMQLEKALAILQSSKFFEPQELAKLRLLVDLELDRDAAGFDITIPYTVSELHGYGFSDMAIRALIYQRVLVGVNSKSHVLCDCQLVFNRECLSSVLGHDEQEQTNHADNGDSTTTMPGRLNGALLTSPRWSLENRVLEFEGAVVKRFRCPAQNQESILSAFEEEAWPSTISDPLPPMDAMSAKQRLHDAIRSLNRNQANRLIKFGGDGTGEGITWSKC